MLKLIKSFDALQMLFYKLFFEDSLHLQKVIKIALNIKAGS